MYLWCGEKEFLQQAVESWIWRNRKINLHVKGTKFCWNSAKYWILRVRLFMTSVGQRLKRVNWAGWGSRFRSMRWQSPSNLSERALQPKAAQGPDEADGNPVHLLRHPHGKRGAAGGQDRAESTTGGCLKQKYAHRKVLSRGNYASVIESGQKIRPKRPDWDIKT